MSVRAPAPKLLAVLVALAASQSASADALPTRTGFNFDPDITQSSVYRFKGGLEPAPIRAEPFFITPLLNLSFGRDDNVLLDDNNKRSSVFVGVGPSINVALPKGPDQYYLNYLGNYGIYTSEDDSNYYDHTLALGAMNDWTVRARSMVELNYMKGHDPAGSTSSATTKPDEWHNTALRGSFSYGAQGATGQIEASAGFGARRYDTNRALTATKDRDQADFSAAFLYRLGPATQALIEARYSDIDYVSAGSTQDSNETRYLLGAKWVMTAITSGVIKVGQVKKAFDSVIRKDYEGIGWEGGLTWSPKPYTRLNLALSQSPGEATGTEDYMLTRQTTLSWQHDWTDLTQTTLSFTDAKDDFEGAGQTRKDNRRILSARITYGVSRWLRTGLEFQHHVRNSNDNSLDYKRNLIMLTLEGSL